MSGQMDNKEPSGKKMLKGDQSKAPKIETGIRLRSQQVQHHHLFKAELSKMKKDLTAWKKGNPKIVGVEHVHFFHSINSFGMPQTTTNEVGGHFHEISWDLDDSGTPRAKCGPPLRKIMKKGRNGMKRTSIVPVEFDVIPDDDESSTKIKDEHVHPMTYHGSDEISTSKVQEIQRKNAEAIQKMTPPKPVDFDLIDQDGDKDQ